MNDQIFCQSCGMPMTEEAHFGTDADGSRNRDYCCYCYQKGAFTADCTMEEMIEFCIDAVKDITPNPYGDPDTAREAMRQWFPMLKRWRKDA